MNKIISIDFCADKLRHGILILKTIQPKKIKIIKAI